jgi:hypothetical protein
MTQDERWIRVMSSDPEEFKRLLLEAIHEMDEAEDSDTSQSAGPH